MKRSSKRKFLASKRNSTSKEETSNKWVSIGNKQKRLLKSVTSFWKFLMPVIPCHVGASILNEKFCLNLTKKLFSFSTKSILFLCKMPMPGRPTSEDNIQLLCSRPTFKIKEVICRLSTFSKNLSLTILKWLILSFTLQKLLVLTI